VANPRDRFRMGLGRTARATVHRLLRTGRWGTGEKAVTDELHLQRVELGLDSDVVLTFDLFEPHTAEGETLNPGSTLTLRLGYANARWLARAIADAVGIDPAADPAADPAVPPVLTAARAALETESAATEPKEEAPRG
jgi:hypothetical protein